MHRDSDNHSESRRSGAHDDYAAHPSAWVQQRGRPQRGCRESLYRRLQCQIRTVQLEGESFRQQRSILAPHNHQRERAVKPNPPKAPESPNGSTFTDIFAVSTAPNLSVGPGIETPYEGYGAFKANVYGQCPHSGRPQELPDRFQKKCEVQMIRKNPQAVAADNREPRIGLGRNRERHAVQGHGRQSQACSTSMGLGDLQTSVEKLQVETPLSKEEARKDDEIVRKVLRQRQEKAHALKAWVGVCTRRLLRCSPKLQVPPLQGPA